jgi:preprotein translocase subunit SecD
MKIKSFLLLAACIVANKSFAQRRDELICANDTGKIKIESALYILMPIDTETNGLRVYNGDKYYCIEKNNKMTLENMDSLSIGFDNYSKTFNLNFHFNKVGASQLASFSTNNINKEAGFFINNKLISAARITGSIESGNMTLGGNFSESELSAFKKEIEAVVHK